MTDVGYVEDAELAIMALVFRDPCGNTFEIQRALTFDHQDYELGMDTYCLVVQAGATFYGGVAKWSLSDDMLELVLQPEAAQFLGLPHLVRLPLTVAGVQIVEERLPTLIPR